MWIARTIIARYSARLFVLIEEAAPLRASVHVGLPPRLGRDQAEVKLEGICEACDSFFPAWILADYHSFLPVLYVGSYPSCNQRFCVEVVDWLAEETLRGQALNSC